MIAIVNVDCLFCNIINKKIDSFIIYENKYVISFLDINPASNGHCLIIPKKHFNKLSETDELYLMETIKAAKIIAKNIYKNLNCLGINYLVNENEIAGQSVNHFHYHVIPKYSKETGFVFKQIIDKNFITNINDMYKKIGKII